MEELGWLIEQRDLYHQPPIAGDPGICLQRPFARRGRHIGRADDLELLTLVGFKVTSFSRAHLQLKAGSIGQPSGGHSQGRKRRKRGGEATDADLPVAASSLMAMRLTPEMRRAMQVAGATTEGLPKAMQQYKLPLRT